MVNYGYDCEGWTKQMKEKLATALQELCHRTKDSYGMSPYVEVDGLYKGVRIRRITHLIDNEEQEFELEADSIYFKVCKELEIPKGEQ